jgi:WD40 repeat protein
LKKYNAIVAGSGDGVIRFWDYETGEHLKNLRGHSKTVIIF